MHVLTTLITMTTIHEHTHLQLSFHEEKKYLHCIWKGTVLTEEALAAYKKGLSFMRKNEVLMWIDDFRQINLPPEETIAYIEHIWYPDAESFGLQKHAFLVKEMGIEVSIFEDAIAIARKKTKIEVTFFTDFAKVEEWLQ